jgi:hypothetical protein
MVRRRRVRKQNNLQENPRSARKLDLDKISINQDFNTEFVKAFLYGDTAESIQREEGIRPVFARRQGERRIMKVKIHLPNFKSNFFQHRTLT